MAMAETPALDQATCSSAGAVSTYTPTSVTTTAANEFAFSFANQGGSATITTPPPPGRDMGVRQNCDASMVFKVAAGVVPSQQFRKCGTNLGGGEIKFYHNF